MRIVTFDVDDTLVHTSKNAFLKTKTAGERLWYDSLSAEVFASHYWKIPYRECIEKFFPGIDVSIFTQVYDSLRKEHPYQPIRWALEAIENVVKSGMNVGILTNWPENKTHLKLLALWVSMDVFSIVLHEGKMGCRKPNPAVFAQILQEYTKESILHIWDSIEDFLAAKSAGVRFHWVLTGYTKKEEFCGLWLESHAIFESVLQASEDIHF